MTIFLNNFTAIIIYYCQMQMRKKWFRYSI